MSDHPAQVRIAVKTGVQETSLRSYPWPDLRPDEGMLKIEACGVGGAEPEVYRAGDKWLPVAMGHQIVGSVVAMGADAARLWKVAPGERVVIQEYLPCKACRWCLQGEYRFCPDADFFGGTNPRRYGLIDPGAAPHLVGGFAEYIHLPWNTVFHKIPQDLPAELATLAIPIGNGVQWVARDVNAGPGKTVLIIGPGQQGLGAVLGAKDAGAETVILAGMTRDAARLALAPELGADAVINVEEETLDAGLRRILGARGLDVVVDTTGDPGGANMDQYLAHANYGAWLWVNCMDRGVPVREIKRKFLTVRSGRGRSWWAVDTALRIITSRRFPLEKMCTHRFGLDEVDLAIKATAGREVEGAIHVVVDPWK
ncbi:zinc-binding dehydrogenase [Sphingomonas canadensis]|uniref:Zinc-binding dehydrogenase n=1 Tax=Sphingomonas canadensis TaxID=1219257 RepID=A0ABW3HFY8_9SPHN|nr:zinc-binding dehydrogenase [Sphingomonas canadensis]MCW3838321.1 zinc-binding dehydrogenase [Sphingomonas canadensis]